MSLEKVDIGTYENVDYRRTKQDIEFANQLALQMPAEKRNIGKAMQNNGKGVIFITKQEVMKHFNKQFPEFQFLNYRDQLLPLYIQSISLRETSSPNTYELFLAMSDEIQNQQEMTRYLQNLQKAPILESEILTEEQKQYIERIMDDSFTNWTKEELDLLLQKL